MAILLILLLLSLSTSNVYAQEIKPLYQLPERTGIQYSSSGVDSNVFIVGTETGLYQVKSNNAVQQLWADGRVEQLVRVKMPVEEGTTVDAWVMRTSKGIIYTEDLKTFYERNTGLPSLVIKKYKDGQTSLVNQIQELKDLCVNPENNLEMVTATKEDIYFSCDGGQNWISLGSMSKKSPGVKAVCVASLDSQTVVFMAHPIFGLSYIYPYKKKSTWTDIAQGFEMMPSLTSPDEISDILPVRRTNPDGSVYTEIYIAQSYIPRIYKLNWEKKEGELIYQGTEPVDAIDGLTTIDDILVYTHLEGFGAININNYMSPGTPSKFNEWNTAFSAVPGMPNTAWIPQSRSGFGKGILLNELWLLYPGTINSPYAEKANGKKAIYISAYQCRNQAGINKFRQAVKERNLNSIVIDMKDDYGYLRYNTKNPLLLEKGKVSGYAIDLDHFVKEFKADNIYLIARIVTFKDRNLTKYSGGKYAVWDKKYNRPWTGIKGYEKVKNSAGELTGETQTLYYDENWVDPYSEEVWEYNITVAKELIARGFDEIQFDYIRFPTDGENLYNAQFRFQDKGMDKESALISFLSFARENIDAPIGIDIYGANGWYRSGARTGQDSEMLAEYVDVIGPMFYPSHFEQTFLNYAPVADRTYRIYYYGSFRNTVICRNRALIRPWVQSFYLGSASYDHQYYDSNYIKKEFFGVRDSINRGYMCWNNLGDYSTTPADVTDTEPFPGTAAEASTEFKKPAIGTAMRPLYYERQTDLSVLDSILQQYSDDSGELVYTPFLQLPAAR